MSTPNPFRAAPVAGVGRSRAAELLATHTVLRNTYLLLAATLLFSALTASLSMAMGMRFLNPLLSLAISFGLLFWVQKARNSGWGLVAVFAFTGFFGFITGPMISLYLRAVPNGGQIVMTALGGTGLIFAAMSAYALTTRRDLSKLGSFLMIGAIVLMVASIANIFLHISGLQLAISAAAMVVFSGLMLYDTSRIIDGGETNYISATVSLYLDIYNVFISLLNLLSGSSRN